MLRGCLVTVQNHLRFLFQDHGQVPVPSQSHFLSLLVFSVGFLPVIGSLSSHSQQMLSFGFIMSIHTFPLAYVASVFYLSFFCLLHKTHRNSFILKAFFSGSSIIVSFLFLCFTMMVYYFGIAYMGEHINFISTPAI